MASLKCLLLILVIFMSTHMMASRAATSRRYSRNRLRLRNRSLQMGAGIPVNRDASQGTAEAAVDAAIARAARNRQRRPVNHYASQGTSGSTVNAALARPVRIRRRRAVRDDASRGTAVASVDGVPSRKDEPCRYKYCYHPHHHSMLEDKDWTPKHFGYQTKWRLGPANRHTKPGTGETLDWVVRQRGYQQKLPKQQWNRLRPHGDAIGPEVLSCQSVQPYKFYLMEEALNPACRTFSSGEELVRVVPRGGGQHMGELFFYWQLKNHTWRTYNPHEAQLVVVPFFPTLVVRGMCGNQTEAVNHFLDALEAFPRYKLNKGRDFAMMSTDFIPQNELFWDKKSRFHEMTMNFIYVTRLNGKFIKTRFIQAPNRCVVAAPYTSRHAVSKCVGNSKDGMSCPGLEHNEDTFEDFMERRNLTMFFLGQADHRIAYQSRRIIVTQVSQLRGPNYMVAIGSFKRNSYPKCDRHKHPSEWNGCYFFKANTDVYQEKLMSSKISIMAGGDDPTTSRFYDSLTYGTPQMVISEGFYDQGAPFRCAVDHASIAYYLNEVDFQTASHIYMDEALEDLLKDDAALLRKKWEAQRAAAKDLLWHVPGSRVTQNLLEDIHRRCLTDLRGNNDAA